MHTVMSDYFPIHLYRRSDLLGEGAFAEVWLYQRSNSGGIEEVAVKRYKSGWGWDELGERCLFGEDRLQHPNIVACYGVCDLQDGRSSLVLERCHTDLEKYLRARFSCISPKSHL